MANRANLLTGLRLCACLVPPLMACSTVAGLPPSIGLRLAFPRWGAAP
jgi:MFS superfamily sulfate permease-like transporter